MTRKITLAPHTLNLIEGLSYFTKCMIQDRLGFYPRKSSLLRYLESENLSSVKVEVCPQGNFIDCELVARSIDLQTSDLIG
jgi:hypothetical protein